MNEPDKTPSPTTPKARNSDPPGDPETGTATAAGETSAASWQNPTGTEAPTEDLRGQLDEALVSLAEHKELYLRAKAEAENVKRRAQADVSNAHKYGIERFATELLAVKDSLDLAREVQMDATSEAAVGKMREGLDLTSRQLETVFDRFAVACIAPRTGDKFDPELHQAMTTQESADVQPNHIVNVIQVGYSLNQRLLRPAMVIVARAPAEKPANPDAGS